MPYRGSRSALAEAPEHLRHDAIAIVSAELEHVPLRQIDLLGERLAEQALGAKMSAAHCKAPK